MVFSAIYLTFAGLTCGQSLLTNYTFNVPEFIAAGDDQRLAIRLIEGDERSNNSLNRLSMISGNQLDYPEPESGCAPVAMLNILVWYEKYGLIEPLFRSSDLEEYKLKLFREIDARLLEKSGTSRTEIGGTSSAHIMVVMDEIVRQQSGGQLRVHTNFYHAPLQLEDLLQTMPNFRAGYLVGRPIHPRTGEIFSSHGMSLIRVDRAGYLTLATWGQKYRGLLQQRNGRQIFVPQDPNQYAFEIQGFYRFIPFEPTTPASR